MVQFVRGIDHVCGPDCRGSLSDGIHVEYFTEVPDGPPQRIDPEDLADDSREEQERS